MQKLFYIIAILILLSLGACGTKGPALKPFKMDIQQGNVVTSKMLLQLKPGMTKSQVRFIMGTPLVVDSFHQNRWDYFYQLRQAGKVVEQRRVILDFDKDLLAKVRGDVVPVGTAGAASNDAVTNKTITVAPPKKEEKSLLDKLKFWKKDEEKPAISPAEAKTKAIELPSETMPIESPPSEAPIGDAAETNADTPSVLAVPIELPAGDVKPAVELPKVPPAATPKIELPKTAPKPTPALVPDVAPDIKLPDLEPETKALPQSNPVIKPPPAMANGVDKTDEKKIFRLDKSLETKTAPTEKTKNPSTGVKKVISEPIVSKKPAKLTPADANVVNENLQPTPEKMLDTAPAEAVSDKEPSYFERMLEKIGF
jgi:outer membrane protein assembly factor BamE